MCLKIQLCLEMWFPTSVDARWYSEAAKYAKNLLSTLSIVSWWSLMNDRGSVRVKLTKCDKVEWSEKCHYANDILFEWLHVWFVFYCILFYIERKWLLMRNFAIILPLKSKLSEKFQRFNTIDESIGCVLGAYHFQFQKSWDSQNEWGFFEWNGIVKQVIFFTSFYWLWDFLLQNLE